MQPTGWFVMFGVSVLVFTWAKRRQLQDRKREAAWQAKYGQVIAAIRRTDQLSSTLALVSPVVAIVSLIAAIGSLLSAS